MKDTNDFQQLQASSKTFARGKGDRLASSQPPPCGEGDATASLLYLSCPNSDKIKKKTTKVNKRKSAKMRDRGENDTPDNKEYKIMKSLRENIKHWAKIHGEEHIFFLTLTFKENLTDPEEAQRRFNNFNRQFNRIKDVQWYYKGIEPQARGAIHYHIVGVTKFKMNPDQVDWDAYKKMNEYRQKKQWGYMRKYQRIFSQSNVQEVRDMWKVIRRISEGSGMGRSEFLPIRSAGCVAQYVGKYLNKTFASKENGSLPRGVRRFSYSNKAPQPHGRQFSWVKNQKTGLPIWREKVKVWAHGVGVKDLDDVAEKYGKKWAINFRDDINYYGQIWKHEKLRFGHSKPALYPNGTIGNPLAHLPKVELADPFEKSENELWQDWLMEKKTNLRNHARSVEKHRRARKHKKVLSYLYD